MTTAFKLTFVYRRVLDRVSREPGQLQHWSFPHVDRPRVDASGTAPEQLMEGWAFGYVDESFISASAARPLGP